MDRIPILKYKNYDDDDFIDKQIEYLALELKELENNTGEENRLEECLDIWQIALSIILKSDVKAIKKALCKHELKLNSRGWEFDGCVFLDLFKFENNFKK